MCFGCLIFLVQRPCPPLIFSVPLFVLTSLSRLLHCFLTQLIPSLSTFSILLPFQLSLSLCHTVTSHELLDNPTNWNTFPKSSKMGHTVSSELITKCYQQRVNIKVNADIHFPLFYCDTTCEGTNYKHMFPKWTVRQYLVGIRI